MKNNFEKHPLTEAGMLKAVKDAANASRDQVEKLVALGPAAVPSIVSELDRSGKQRRLPKWLMFVGIVLMLASLVIDLIGHNFHAFSLLRLAAMILITSGAYGRVYHARLAAALGVLGNVAAVGPLALSLNSDHSARERALELLTGLLPKMTQDQIDSLSDAEKNALFRSLRLDRRDYREYLTALLPVVQQIGDPGALPIVRPLCGTYVEPVSKAALACRDALEEIERSQREKQSLLRPVEGNGEELLLRSARAQGTDEGLLLRVEEGAE
jgi:hypothetical protein